MFLRPGWKKKGTASIFGSWKLHCAISPNVICMGAKSIYAQALGPAFADLAPALKRLHSHHGSSQQRRSSGVLAVRTGSHLLARVSLWLARLPRAQVDAPCRLCLVPSHRGERWLRDIGPWKFKTHQRMTFTKENSTGEIRERFGPITLSLDLRVKGQSLRVRSVETRILGIRLPGWLGIKVVAHESPVDQESFYCNVRVYLPGLRALIRYRGALKFQTIGAYDEAFIDSACCGSL